jgi:hypothetical protein
LVCDCFHSLFKLLLVHEEVVVKRVKLFVEFKHERDSCRDVVPQDFLFVHSSQLLHNCTEGVAVSYHDHIFVVQNLRADVVVPVGKDSV